MTELTSWTIPRNYWNLEKPEDIIKYQQIVDGKGFSKVPAPAPLSIPPSVIEHMRTILSDTIDANKVDISDIEQYNISWITEGKIPVSKTNKWDTNYLAEATKDDTVLLLKDEIRSLLSPDAVFKIKVSEARSYSDKNTRAFYSWFASVEVIDTADNLTLLKLSLG